MLAILAMLARKGALRVAAGGSAPLVCFAAQAPPLRAVAWTLPGRDRKAGAPIELESWLCDKATWITESRSGLSVTAATGVQLRVCRVQRPGLRWRACW